MAALAAFSYSPPSLCSPELRRVESPPEHVNSPMPYLSPTTTSQTNSKPGAPFLPRSKSDLTMASLPNLGDVHTSSSEVSLTTSTRSASVAQVREERSVGLARSLLSRSSRLLHKRRSSNKLRSMDNLAYGPEGQACCPPEVMSGRGSKHTRLASSGKR